MSEADTLVVEHSPFKVQELVMVNICGNVCIWRFLLSNITLNYISNDPSNSMYDFVICTVLNDPHTGISPRSDP